MSTTRNIEIFSAGCPLCDEAIAAVEDIAGADHAVTVLDLRDEKTLGYARALGVRSAPAVAIDGALLNCCEERGINAQSLRQHLERDFAEEASGKGKGCC